MSHQLPFRSVTKPLKLYTDASILSIPLLSNCNDILNGYTKDSQHDFNMFIEDTYPTMEKIIQILNIQMDYFEKAIFFNRIIFMKGTTNSVINFYDKLGMTVTCDVYPDGRLVTMIIDFGGIIINDFVLFERYHKKLISELIWYNELASRYIEIILEFEVSNNIDLKYTACFTNNIQGVTFEYES